MELPADVAAFDRLMNQVVDCLTPEVAERIASLRASPEDQARLDELAEKNAEGTITSEEWAEYDAIVRAVNLISVLQAKARAIATQ